MTPEPGPERSLPLWVLVLSYVLMYGLAAALVGWSWWWSRGWTWSQP